MTYIGTRFGRIGPTTIASLPAIAVLALLAATLAGCDRSASVPAMKPPQVTVARPLSRQVTDWDEYTGRLAAPESVELRARVSGYLGDAPFSEGAIVHKGDLLFVIDRRPYQAALDAARASLAGTHARLELAELNAARTAQLLGAKLIPQRDFDAATEERKAAAAALAGAEAAVRAAELDLAFCEVRAPIAGRVGRRLVTTGNYVAGGSKDATLLTTLVSVDPIYVYVNADERAYLRYQRLAQTGSRPSSRSDPTAVRLALADEEGFPHQGHMDFVDNQVDPATGTVQGRAVFPNPDGVLTPGMFARVQIVGEGPYAALLVPDAAIATDQARRIVYVVGADNVVQPRVVEPGRREGRLRVLRSGVEAGDRIVINGLQRVRPGVTVEPVDGAIEE